MTEARASDYVGPGLGETAHLGDPVVPRVLAGKRVSLLGDPDAALEWAQQISDGEARQGQLSFILSGQPRRWTLDALESLGLDDAERSEIERMAQLNLASE